MIVLVCRYVLSQNAQRHENASSNDADLIQFFYQTASDTDKGFLHITTRVDTRYNIQKTVQTSCRRAHRVARWFVFWWPEDRVHFAGRACISIGRSFCLQSTSLDGTTSSTIRTVHSIYNISLALYIHFAKRENERICTRGSSCVLDYNQNTEHVNR